jgi:CBS domain-containing protein
MKISQFMTRKVVAATAKATVQELAKKILTGNFSGLPIVDDKLRVIGIVSEFDILKALQHQKENLLSSAIAEEIMSNEPICIDENSELEEAIELMMKYHIIRLPVVRQNKLIGVISRSDILKAHVQDTFITLQDGQITGRE